jgi:hypothetical protein
VLGSNKKEVEKSIDHYIKQLVRMGRSPPNRKKFAANRLVGTIDEVCVQLEELSVAGIKMVNLTVNDPVTEQLLPDLMQCL